ncbi:hypothetical protein ERO13_D13G210850v2 [Gossypium hirsutum]|nr:hypothetical protein ERO13_D13G210850v2 [Gossypium hirsutum]
MKLCFFSIHEPSNSIKMNPKAEANNRKKKINKKPNYSLLFTNIMGPKKKKEIEPNPPISQPSPPPPSPVPSTVTPRFIRASKTHCYSSCHFRCR